MDESQLATRLSAIEARLSAIESRFAPPAAPHAAAPARPQGQPIPPRWASNFVPQPAPEYAPIPATASVIKPGNWLGLIAIACFVLAAGFIVKLSIESGWLTPARQIGIAALLGFGLCGAGWSLMKTDREYASLLPGAGIVVFYLTAFAAHRYYGLIPFESALLITSLVAAASVWLYTVVRHDAYAIVAAVGAYVAPVLLGFKSGGAEFSQYYFLLCSAAFAALSVLVQSRSLTVIAAYLAILISGALGLTLGNPTLMASALALHFIIFTLGTYLYTQRNASPLLEKEAWAFMPVLLVFYALEYYYLNQVSPTAAPWISLCFAGVLIGFYAAAKRSFPEGLGSHTLLVAFTTLVGFHAIYIELLPDTVKPWLFVLAALLFAFTSVRLPEGKIRSIALLPVLAIQAIVAIEYLSIVWHALMRDGHHWLMVSLAAAASCWCALIRREDVQDSSYVHVLLGAVHIITISALWRFTTETGSLAVSASWLFYGVAVILFASVRRDRLLAKSALFILALAAGKALLYDAASAPTIIRIGCLLLTGVVLYGCGLLLRKVANWNDSETRIS